MLVKKIDLGSIPMGLYEAGEDLVKGSAVVVKNDKLFNPSTKEEAGAVLGFCTRRIDVPTGGDIADHDIIPKGTKAVVYTLVKNNMWGTTAIDGVLAVGDSVAISYAVDKRGKIVKAGADVGINDATPLFVVFEVGKAGSYDLVAVSVK